MSLFRPDWATVGLGSFLKKIPLCAVEMPRKQARQRRGRQNATSHTLCDTTAKCRWLSPDLHLTSILRRQLSVRAAGCQRHWSNMTWFIRRSPSLIHTPHLSHHRTNCRLLSLLPSSGAARTSCRQNKAVIPPTRYWFGIAAPPWTIPGVGLESTSGNPNHLLMRTLVTQCWTDCLKAKAGI